MLLSTKNRKNRLVLSFCFTFTQQFIPQNSQLNAFGFSRLLAEDDKKNGRFLTTVKGKLTKKDCYCTSICTFEGK